MQITLTHIPFYTYETWSREGIYGIQYTYINTYVPLSLKHDGEYLVCATSLDWDSLYTSHEFSLGASTIVYREVTEISFAHIRFSFHGYLPAAWTSPADIQATEWTPLRQVHPWESLRNSEGSPLLASLLTMKNAARASYAIFWSLVCSVPFVLCNAHGFA
jgi:hypothetical protein